MLCRLLLGAIFLLYLICVLILSGVQREDLEVSLLTKLEHYDINLSDALNNVTVLEECLSTADKAPNSSNETDKSTIKPNTRYSMLLSTNSPISNEKLSKTNDVIEIGLDSDPVETYNQNSNNTNTKVKHRNKIKPISVQEILKLWESYATPNSDANEDLTQEIFEINQPEVKDNDKILQQVNKSYKSKETSANSDTDDSKISKKSVDDYISKQFEKYIKNINKTKNVKRKRIQVKLNKSRKQAKILIDSKGVKEYSFLNIPVSTDVPKTTMKMTASDAAEKLVFSDSIIDKIAKSVKTLVIEDLRKEFQPLRYKLPTSTTTKCCPVDVTESSSTTTFSTTTEMTTTTVLTIPTTLENISAYNAANPITLLSHTLKKEHLLALEKFLEIFGLQNQDRPVISTTEQPAVVNYPYTLQPFQKGHPINFNNEHIKNSDPMVLFKPIYGGSQPNIVNPQYKSNNNKAKPKLVFTLQSDIEDIPPLQIPNKGVHVFQNIIVSTKTPDSRQNEKQRWWKSKRMPYPIHRQATRAPATPSYDPSGMESDNFPSQAPIRMSKGKMWGPMYEQQSNGRFRRPPHTSRHNENKRFRNVAKYHELLEFGPEYTSGFERPDESQDDGTSHGVRLQHPLTHKKTYNEAPFKKIMQTQQRVNDMLEKILEMNKYPNDNIQEGSNFF